jgi:hypothetical protein
LFDRRDHDAMHEERAYAAPAPSDEAARMLALQRSAGNVALARYLAPGMQGIARQDGYDPPDNAGDAYQTQAGEDSLDESESSEEPAMDPVAQLAAAVAARVQETGSAGNPPPAPPSPLRGEQAYGAEDAGTVGYTLYDSGEGEADESEVSEDEPAPTAYSLPGSVPVADDDLTEISEDESESGPPPGLVSYSSAPDRPPRPSTPAPALPSATNYAQPPAPRKRKGKVKRALKAVAKPFKAIGSAIKKAGKRLKGSKKKAKPTAAELLADNTYDVPEEAVPVAPPATKYQNVPPSNYAVGSLRGSGSVHPLGASISSSSSEDDEVSISEDLPAPPPTKYGQLAKMSMSAMEEFDSSDFLNNTLLAHQALAIDMRRFDLAPRQEDNASIMADRARVREGLKRVWGWSEADIKKYYDFGTNRVKQTKVEYIRNEADLKKFVVHAGPSLTYGEPPQPFDTANLVSKASGPGYAIFVMDAQGNIYAGQHRVGLFHHSSFLAGRDVAAAGEMKVTGGRLTHLTAKSGHYFPTPENTWQVVKELAAAGVSFNGVMIKVWVTGGAGAETKIHEGADFLARGPNAKLVQTVGMFQ